MHLLTTKKGREVELDWGTYAMYLYCEKKGIDLKGFGEQMSSMSFDLGVLIAMLQVGVQAAGKPEPTLKDCCDIIDECGGVLAQDGQLHGFLNYVINRTVLKTSEEDVEEKKSNSAA